MEIPIVDGQAERPQEGDAAQQQHINQGEMVAPIEGGAAELGQQDPGVQPEQTMHESELEAPAEDSTYHSPSPEAPLHESEMKAPIEDISNEPKSPDTPAAREILPDVQDSTQGDALITDKEEAVEAAYAAKPFEDAKIEKVTDFVQIAKLGVMKLPGLVIDGKVIFSGRMADKEEIKEILSKY